MVDTGGDTCASIAKLCDGVTTKKEIAQKEKEIRAYNKKRYPGLDRLQAGNKRADGMVAFFQKDTIIYVQEVPKESAPLSTRRILDSKGEQRQQRS